MDPGALYRGDCGAAGIGLAATGVFLLLDVMLLQNIGTYTDRWYAIGGGSNWWYHPVWWMAGTFLPWMGAWILANQTARNGRPSVGVAFLTVVGLAVLSAVVGILIGVPRGPLDTRDVRGRVSPGTGPGCTRDLDGEAPRLSRCAGFACSFASSDGCSRLFSRGQLHFWCRRGRADRHEVG